MNLFTQNEAESLSGSASRDIVIQSLHKSVVAPTLSPGNLKSLTEIVNNFSIPSKSFMADLVVPPHLDQQPPTALPGVAFNPPGTDHLATVTLTHRVTASTSFWRPPRLQPLLVTPRQNSHLSDLACSRYTRAGLTSAFAALRSGPGRLLLPDPVENARLVHNSIFQKFQLATSLGVSQLLASFRFAVGVRPKPDLIGGAEDLLLSDQSKKRRPVSLYRHLPPQLNKLPELLADGSAQNAPPSRIKPEHISVSEKSMAAKDRETASGERVRCYAVRSRTGKVPTKPNKVNQDSYLVMKDPMNIQGAYYFGVMDGHGTFGHEASDLIKRRLPANLALMDAIMSKSHKDSPSEVHHPTYVASKCPFVSSPAYRASMLTKAYNKTNDEVRNANFDASYSGSTTITVYINGSVLVCANVGDSRAIIGSIYAPETGWKSRKVSVDHKPDSKDEYERILKAGGRVDAYRDENGKPLGPSRVWTKSHNVPGLAMSRSLGDVVASRVGVICTPDIFEVELKESDKIVVIASDGVWGVLTNDKVIQVVSKFYRKGSVELACERLIEEATTAWISAGAMIDDITVIVVFLT